MREVQIEAKSVQTAVEKGLTELGLRRDQVEVVVKNEGSSGFFGIGAKPATVIVRERKWRADSSSSGEAARAPSREQNSRGYTRPGGGAGGQSRGGGNRCQDRRGGGPGRNGGNRPERGGNRQGGRRNADPNGNPRQRRNDGFYSVNAETFEKIPTAAIAEQGRQQLQQQQQELQAAQAQQPQPPVAVETASAQTPPQPAAPQINYEAVPAQYAEAAESAKTALGEILTRMGVEHSDIRLGWDAGQGRIMLDFDCGSPEVVIGKDGRTIEALQYLIVLMLSRKTNAPIAAQVDTNGYWRQLESRVTGEVNRAIAGVEGGGRVYRLEPMPAALRRFVHKMLSNHPKVETYSEGEGQWRKVVIKSRQEQKI
ncbi:MAG: Jag N-terminal domain-containing protein [Elusimicrobiales bacterium]|nr:Jag N-terminal domain-containing protein [Elusimicrobiales bacterium]